MHCLRTRKESHTCYSSSEIAQAVFNWFYVESRNSRIDSAYLHNPWGKGTQCRKINRKCLYRRIKTKKHFFFLYIFIYIKWSFCFHQLGLKAIVRASWQFGLLSPKFHARLEFLTIKWNKRENPLNVEYRVFQWYVFTL